MNIYFINLHFVHKVFIIYLLYFVINLTTAIENIIKFKEELYSTNLVLMKCGNLVFDAEIIKNNIGWLECTD